MSDEPKPLDLDKLEALCSGVAEYRSTVDGRPVSGMNGLVFARAMELVDAVPALIAEVRRLRAEVTRLDDQMEREYSPLDDE